ncbi:Fe-S cluster assembly iron-binding protein IscA [Dehalogenimonas formicexedens]|uniref:Fe-S cluster assembly iron-binding protein IscA n=1 Tax=Dehalogenimonas formicexedens TaxID=1839801 RepID=A0A1P8F748_9CHLR|nr:hypothetical protein [Dehalogenimonas formicexedens]APV44306.1 Fe-S cluster assembly iron-binding protein IscA [Dehalogenimonas formicexedens]
MDTVTLSVSPKAVGKLKDILAERCRNRGIGFRLLPTAGRESPNGLTIKLDKVTEADRIILVGEMLIFVEPAVLKQFNGWRLDYSENEDVGLCLMRTNGKRPEIE